MRLLAAGAPTSESLIVLGGLVPQTVTSDLPSVPAHLGTTDVDILLATHLTANRDLSSIEDQRVPRRAQALTDDPIRARRPRPWTAAAAVRARSKAACGISALRRWQDLGLEPGTPRFQAQREGPRIGPKSLQTSRCR